MRKICAFLVFSLLAFGTVNSQVTYTGKPMYQIDIKRAGLALGSVTVELFPNIAYHHVRNFDSLVGVKFYDTTAFHRVIPGFMIQGGDPNSRHGNVSTWGFGQPSQPNVNAEFSAAKHVRGILSAARSNNINSATSQFFICVAPAPQLNNQYSVYGRVTKGMNWVDTVVNASTSSNSVNRPNIKHEMFITAIGSNDTVPKPPVLTSPVDMTDSVPVNAPLLLKWNAVKDGIIYTIEVSDDQAFVNIIATGETGNTSFYVNSGLTMSSTYYWRVKTNNGGHFSPWSSVFTFLAETPPVENPVGIVSRSVNKEKPSIYPNPSSGKFTFSNLQKGDKLEIYDVTGRRVYETLVKENTLTLDLEGRERGIYAYKLSSDKRDVLSGKLILK